VKGENPLVLDSKAPKLPVADYMRMENRFRMLEISNPEAARKFFAEAQMDVKERWEYYSYMASRPGADVGIGE
jgi:pyruvate-ferredoxin/flavodoxin oxidoreductase